MSGRAAIDFRFGQVGLASCKRVGIPAPVAIRLPAFCPGSIRGKQKGGKLIQQARRPMASERLTKCPFDATQRRTSMPEAFFEGMRAHAWQGIL